jgi:hypothetical protein
MFCLLLVNTSFFGWLKVVRFLVIGKNASENIKLWFWINEWQGKHSCVISYVLLLLQSSGQMSYWFHDVQDNCPIKVKMDLRGWCVSAFRTSSTHYKDAAVSVHKSQDCGNIQKPACTKSSQKGKWKDAPRGSTRPVSSQDATPSENRPEHRPSAVSFR